MTVQQRISLLRGWLALSPLVLFMALYLGTSLSTGDFYAMPVAVAFLLASVYALAITPKMTARARLDLFSRGAADPNILLMIWIFILAGSFAACAKSIGCIDATVGMVLHFLPGRLVPAGLFVGACFISLSIGTSVGTVVALVPMAAGIAQATGTDVGLMVAIVVGGAFFGDNLSFISDTTIAATRTQGCDMTDKFRANFKIVMPAALLVLLYYIWYGWNNDMPVVDTDAINYVKVLPYLIVLVGALVGINVAVVLVLGIVSVFAIDIASGGAYILGWFSAMGEGIASMSDLITVTLLAGGMLEVIRHNGGIAYLLQTLTRHVNGRRGAALTIAALVSVANVCTANNTIAIITVGNLASDISRRFGLQPRRVASLLDTFSCVIQGILPYGAQLLMAGSLALISPLAIIRYLYYPMALLVCALASIALYGRFTRKTNVAK